MKWMIALLILSVGSIQVLAQSPGNFSEASLQQWEQSEMQHNNAEAMALFAKLSAHPRITTSTAAQTSTKQTEQTPQQKGAPSRDLTASGSPRENL